MRNPGVDQDLSGLAAAVQLRLRVVIHFGSIAAMQRSLKPQSTGQHRGDPPSFRQNAVAEDKALLYMRWMRKYIENLVADLTL